MVWSALDAVEVLEQQSVRAGKADEVGRCPRGMIVEVLVQAELLFVGLLLVGWLLAGSLV